MPAALPVRTALLRPLPPISRAFICLDLHHSPMLTCSSSLALVRPSPSRLLLAPCLRHHSAPSCAVPPTPSSVSANSAEPQSELGHESYKAEAQGERLSDSASFGSTRVGIVRLPDALVEGVQSVVQSVPNRSTIRTAALSLYSRYRLVSPRGSLEKTVDELRASIDDKGPFRETQPTVKAKLKTSYDHLDTISYAAGAMPATYGATLRVLAETRRRLSSERAASTTPVEWKPAVILDYGSGTGGAAWAVKEIWPESPIRYYGLEKSSSMIWLSDHLLNPPPHTSKTHPRPSKLHGTFHRLTISASKSPKASKDPLVAQNLMEALAEADANDRSEVDFDLPDGTSEWKLEPNNLMAVMSFTLSDLPNADARRQAISGMWNSGAQTIVVIDRGTPAGFKVVADARQQLLTLGRRAINNSQSDDIELDEHAREPPTSSFGSWVLAPCPHDQACPLHYSSNPKHFCHFSQRIERPRFLRDTKHTDKPEEDAKFSYVVIRRGLRPRTAVNTQSLPAPIPVESGVLSNGKTAQLPSKPMGLGHHTDRLAEQEWMKLSLDWPRIILPPHKRKGHVILDVCASSGHIERMTIPRSQGKQDYYDARKSHWGDSWPHGSKKPGLVKDLGGLLARRQT